MAVQRVIRFVVMAPAIIEHFADNCFNDVIVTFRWRHAFGIALLSEIDMLQNVADQQRLGDKADDLHLRSAARTCQRINSPSQFLLTTYRLFGKS